MTEPRASRGPGRMKGWILNGEIMNVTALGGSKKILYDGMAENGITFDTCYQEPREAVLYPGQDTLRL